MSQIKNKALQFACCYYKNQLDYATVLFAPKHRLGKYFLS